TEENTLMGNLGRTEAGAILIMNFLVLLQSSGSGLYCGFPVVMAATRRMRISGETGMTACWLNRFRASMATSNRLTITMIRMKRGMIQTRWRREGRNFMVDTGCREADGMSNQLQRRGTPIPLAE